MERQIKFRGKHLCGQWYFGNLIVREVDSPVPETKQAYRCVCIGDIEDGSAEEVEEDTIGQFTGLHDKNGKEIYEGDILLWHTMYLSVEWRQEDCRYVLVGCHDNGYVLNAYKCNIEDDFEVIGNIHEK